MSRITVGVDGSHHASKALEWAMTEAALRKLPLTVITVNEVLPSQATGQPVTTDFDAQRLAEARQVAEELVTAATKRLDGEQPEVTVTAVNGFAANVLIDASADADLLVVGNRGQGGFPRLSLGAVASKVAHHAHCPVVVVPTRSGD